MAGYVLLLTDIVSCEVLARTAGAAAGVCVVVLLLDLISWNVAS
jgi:hypothetical protein